MSTKKMYNILNGQAVRAMLFTLLIEKSDRLIDDWRKFDDEYANLHEIERNMHLLNRFPTSSTYVEIKSDDSIIPLGNKTAFEKDLKPYSDYIYALSSYNWPINYIHNIDNGLPNRVHINQQEIYGDTILTNDFASYIKEYYIQKTNKKQFGKDKLMFVCAALNMIYLDICGWLLAAETAGIDNYEDHNQYKMILKDINRKNKDCPIQHIIPVTTLARLVITDNPKSQPYMPTPRTDLFCEGIKILCEKFNYDMSQVSHILKVGFERFLVYMSENIKEDTEFPPLLKRLNRKDIKKYTMLVGIRAIDTSTLPSYKKYIEDTAIKSHTIN